MRDRARPKAAAPFFFLAATVSCSGSHAGGDVEEPHALVALTQSNAPSASASSAASATTSSSASQKSPESAPSASLHETIGTFDSGILLFVDATSLFFLDPSNDLHSMPKTGGPTFEIARNRCQGAQTCEHVDVAQDATRIFALDDRVYEQPGPRWIVDGRVEAYPKKGGAPVAFKLLRRGDAVRYLAVEGDDLYWMEGPGSADARVDELVKAPVAGGSTSVVAHVPFAQGFVVDAKAAYVATANDGRRKGALLRVPLHGGAPTTLVADLDFPNETLLLSDATHVYFAQGDDLLRIAKAAPHGTKPDFVANRIGACAVDETYVYGVVDELVRTKKDGSGKPESLDEAVSSAAVVDRGFVYYLQGSEVRRRPTSP